MLDANGVAVVIGAVTAGLVSLGTLGMQIISWRDQRRLKLAQDSLLLLSIARDAQIQKVKDLVNGQSEKLLDYAAKEAYEKGREHERVAPGTASPTVAVVKQPVVATQVATIVVPEDPGEKS